MHVWGDCGDERPCAGASGVSEATLARCCNTCGQVKLIDACEKCNGTGVAKEGAHISTCGKCNGTGAKQYTDFERASCAGLPVESWPKHVKRFEGVATCMYGAIAATSGRVRELLA